MLNLKFAWISDPATNYRCEYQLWIIGANTSCEYQLPEKLQLCIDTLFARLGPLSSHGQGFPADILLIIQWSPGMPASKGQMVQYCSCAPRVCGCCGPLGVGCVGPGYRRGADRKHWSEGHRETPSGGALATNLVLVLFHMNIWKSLAPSVLFCQSGFILSNQCL